MRLLRSALTACALGLLLAGTASAQTIGGSAPRMAAGAPAGNPVAAFQALSAGDQKIARVLFEAQTPPVALADDDATPLTLNQIAALHAGRSWDGVFKEMKAKRLVAALSLRAAIISYEHPTRGTGDGSGIVTVTTASGRTSIVGSTRRTQSEAQ